MSEKAEVNKGASKVASGISKVLDAVGKQGSLVTQCVSAIKAVYKGAEVPKADIEFIANNVARIQKWSASSRGPRMSNVRKIVRNYTSLPEAVEKFSKKNGGATWHDAMKVATQLNGGKTVNQAVAAMTTKQEAATVPAPKRIAALLTSINNVETRSAKIIAFRKELNALAAKHGV